MTHVRWHSFGALASAAALFAMASPALANDGELVVVATGGAFEEALEQYFYPGFEEASGVDIVHVSSSLRDAYARVHAMTEVGNVEWDVVSAVESTLLAERDVLEPLDCSRIPNAAAFGVDGTCGEYGLLRTIGGAVIAYNTETFPDNPPITWEAFWDVDQYPGTRCLPEGRPEWVYPAALLADGVAPEDVYPLDFERAEAKIAEIVPHVTAWWPNNNDSQNTLRNGECDVSLVLSGRAIQVINQDFPIAISWQQHMPVIGYWAILRDAPNKDAAYAFLDHFMTNPEAHLAFSRDLVYDTSNRMALDLVTAEEMPLRSLAPENIAQQIPVDFAFLADNLPDMRTRYRDVISR